MYETVSVKPENPTIYSLKNPRIFSQKPTIYSLKNVNNAKKWL